MNNGTTPLVVRGYSLSAGPSFYEFKRYVWSGTTQPPKRGPKFKPSRPCTVDGCAGTVHAKDMCSSHYHKQARGLDLHADRRHKPFDPALCGSLKGYFRHRNNGVPMCQPCREAKNAYDRERYARLAAAK